MPLIASRFHPRLGLLFDAIGLRCIQETQIHGEFIGPLGASPLTAMWRFTKNNGITEGFHRKMKLIQRRAYGFKNFNNYRLRVIAQCG